jgi:nucleoside-diphosphate-sugar epimerase
MCRKSPAVSESEYRVNADLTADGFEKQLPGQIECVVHLAQSPGYRDFPASAQDIYQVNVGATFKLLEWCRQSGVKTFILASTANVYGPSEEVLRETNPTAPNSFYGATKLAAEHLARQYQKYFRVDILRLFTVYGPRQEKMLISSTIERIKASSEISLASGIGVYLTPIYVGDVVNIIERLIIAEPSPISRTMNVCGDRAVSLREIITFIEGLLGLRASIKVTDAKPESYIGSDQCLRNSIADLRLVDMKDGLRETVLFMNQ